jgi:arginine/lysine/ornithine decarboxylase
MMQRCMQSAEELLCPYPSGIPVIAHGEVKMQEALV